MKYLNNQLKSLPKVEVSFQDDFSGSKREYTLTPSYVLRELQKLGLDPKIGDEILLWEKDDERYMCNIGRIAEASTAEDTSEPISEKEKPRLGNVPICVEIDRSGYFDLSIDSEVF